MSSGLYYGGRLNLRLLTRLMSRVRRFTLGASNRQVPEGELKIESLSLLHFRYSSLDRLFMCMYREYLASKISLHIEKEPYSLSV
jgi:hypothetical protein